MDLTATNVERTYAYCRYSASCAPENVVQVRGVTKEYSFNKQAIEAHKEHIRLMLSFLPDQFHKELGGGWAFSMGHCKRNGTQWTYYRDSMELLFCMGIAAGFVEKVEMVLTSLTDPYYVVDVGIPPAARDLK